MCVCVCSYIRACVGGCGVSVRTLALIHTALTTQVCGWPEDDENEEEISSIRAGPGGQLAFVHDESTTSQSMHTHTATQPNATTHC